MSSGQDKLRRRAERIAGRTEELDEATLDALRASAPRHESEEAEARLQADSGVEVSGCIDRLVAQVEVMVEESGESQGFDARQWLSRWLVEPVPALGSRRPQDLLDTREGQAVVAETLARMQSGAFS